jgi:hypothetical protein
MILRLIQRDPAWKFTPWLTAAAVIAALLYSRYGGSILGAMAGLIVVFFMRAQPHRRVTFFEAALPIAARDLLLARFLSLMALIWLPATAVAAALLLTGNGAFPASAVAGFAAIVLTLGVILILSTRDKEFAAPIWVTMACPAAAAIVLVLTLGLKHSVPIPAICGVVAVGLGALTWKRVPEAFQCVPVAVSAPRKDTGSDSPSLPWWPVIRSLLPWQSAIIIPISLWWVATGMWFFAPMYMMMAYSQSQLTTRWTVALPISRRTILAMSILPVLFLLGASAELGMLTGYARQGRDLVRQGDPSHFRPTGTVGVWVNPAFWQIAPGGRVPVIRAPWGEGFQPEPVRLLSLTLYNPYATGEKNSQPFEEWQFGRATSDIYGRPMTPRELAEAKPASLEPITLRPRMQILSIGAILAVALFWAWLVELLSWHRLGRLSAAARKTLAYSGGLVLCAAILGDMLVSKVPGPASQPALEAGLLFVDRHLPSLAALIVVAVIPPVVLWCILDRQAAVSEVSSPVQPAPSLFDRSRP